MGLGQALHPAVKILPPSTTTLITSWSFAWPCNDIQLPQKFNKTPHQKFGLLFECLLPLSIFLPTIVYIFSSPCFSLKLNSLSHSEFLLISFPQKDFQMPLLQVISCSFGILLKNPLSWNLSKLAVPNSIISSPSKIPPRISNMLRMCFIYYCNTHKIFLKL